MRPLEPGVRDRWPLMGAYPKKNCFLVFGYIVVLTTLLFGRHRHKMPSKCNRADVFVKKQNKTNKQTNTENKNLKLIYTRFRGDGDFISGVRLWELKNKPKSNS